MANRIRVKTSSGWQDLALTGPQGAQGIQGVPGPPLTVALTAQAVGAVGQTSQIRAGHQLTAADFSGAGITTPSGIWNLSDLTNVGSAGVALQNKGAVGFGTGINGLANTCAVFTGSTAQALYIDLAGGSANFKIATGSWGCWFRTAKRGTAQELVTKWGVAGQGAYILEIIGAAPPNVLALTISTTGADAPGIAGVSDVCDDRWHFVVATVDGSTMRLYVDGVLEATGNAGPIFGGSSPLNIGARAADAATAAGLPFFGSIDEAFVGGTVLTEDQIRTLYAAKVPHALGSVPKGAVLSVNRYRRGASLVTGDFPATPLRLYNFGAGGSLTDAGSNLTNLVNAYTSLITPVGGADGSAITAYSFTGAHQGLTATDAGLPAGTATRSYGCWLKTTTAAQAGVIGWGTLATADARIRVNGTGQVSSLSDGDGITGPYIADGLWHHVVAVEYNAVGAPTDDGVKRKLYLNGRLVGSSTIMNTLTLAGANRFRVGAEPDGTFPFTGQIDGAFVTNNALTANDIAKLYAKSTQGLGASPKNPGDHIERMTATDLYVIADTLEPQHTVDLGVMG